MRVLGINCTEITELGGVNKVVRRLNEGLQKRGHECSVFYYCIITYAKQIAFAMNLCEG